MNKFYYSKLDSVIEQFNKSNVEKGYSLIEKRLNRNIYELKNAKDSLKTFQLKNGILEIEEQTRASIQNSAILKAELVNLEIQIEAGKALYSPDNSEIKALELRKKVVEEK